MDPNALKAAAQQELLKRQAAAELARRQSAVPGKVDLPSPAPETGLVQNLKIGTQAVGRGVADIAGAPVDLMTGALNAGSGLVNSTALPAAEYLGSWLSGQDVELPRLPRIENPILGSDNIANMAESGFEALGGEAVDYENLTDQQKLGYNIDRFGTQALTSGIGMAKAAVKKAAAEVPALLRPYVGGNAGRTIAGDVAGGAGTGAALTAADEYLPDYLKGPLTTLLAVLGGGIGGNTLLNVAEGLTKGNWSRFTDMLPAGREFQDPETGITPTRKTADQAAQFLQNSASDKNAALAKLRETTGFQSEAGGATPTIGMATDDVGLRYLEKAAALENGPKFARQYEGVAKSAAGDVERLQIPGADMEAPKRLAESTIGRKVADAQGNVAAQEGQLGATLRQTAQDLNLANQGETDLGNVYRPYGGGADAASIDLDRAVVDQTLRPMQAEKNAKYAAIDPNAETMVPADELLKALDEIDAKAASLLPSMKGEVIPQGIADDIRGMTGDPKNLNIPMVPFKTMNDMRPVLSSMESQARAGQKFPLADSIRGLKKATGKASEQLAATGGEAGKRAQEANSYYETEFAPLFNQGEGKNLRKAANADDLARTKTPPTKTAGRFLKEGPGGQEAAADMQRILAASPAGPEGADAARRYVLSDLAKLVGADGRIPETSLQKWINNRQGMLSQIPDLNAEVTKLLSDVRSGAANTAKTKTGGQAATSRMQQEVVAAKRALAQTESDVSKSALSVYLGKNPENAVASVFSSGDPVAKIKELKTAFAGDTAAEQGFRAAAAEHLTKAVTNADGEAVSYAKLAQQFKKNEPALAEIFGEDMKYLRQAQKRLEMLSRKNVQAVAGSGTIENANLLTKAAKPLEIFFRAWYGALQGGSKIRKYKLLSEQFPDGSKSANELVQRAIFDPEVAKHLLMREVEVGTPAWNAKLSRLMAWTAAGRESGKERPKDKAQEGN